MKETTQERMKRENASFLYVEDYDETCEVDDIGGYSLKLGNECFLEAEDKESYFFYWKNGEPCFND
jgi:hypothetical protein